MAQRKRTYRGISIRAAIGYLEKLGGKQVDDQTVRGDGWQASITSDTVDISPVLELTEITVRFEGEEAELEQLIELFSRKAIRAGG